MPDDPAGPARTRLRRAAARGGGRLEVEVVASGARPAATAGLSAWLARVAAWRAAGLVTVALVSDARIRALNRGFRGTDRVTDVLSFPAPGLPPPDVAPPELCRGPPKPRRRRPVPSSSATS